MLISHKHKFITIDIPKTGTRSMRTSLVPLGVIDIVGGPYVTEAVPFEQHGTALEAREQFIKQGLSWSDYYKWVIVRNPWRRYFSFFKYFKAYGEKYTRQDESITWGPVQINQGKYCVELFKNKDNLTVFKNIISNYKSQDAYYSDTNGEIIVDHIAKMENITNEFNQLCDKVNITAPQLKHGNKSSNDLSMQDLYNQQLIDLVAQKERSVIELKGYQFNF